MTAAVLDVIWCFDCAIRRDLVASTALSPFAVKLSEQDMLDLASSTHTSCDSLDLIRILPYPLRRSYPRCAMRNIPGYSSCHGTTDAKFGTPWLDGQSSVYINAQLQEFETS
jgi:cytochrome c553